MKIEKYYQELIEQNPSFEKEIDNLQVCATDLINLLKDRQIGCFSWFELVADKLAKLAAHAKFAGIK